MLRKNCEMKIVETLKENLEIEFILLFGSYAEGNARQDSDLDLAYYAKNKQSTYERFLLANDLSEKCNIQVDLIDLNQIDIVFEAQIYYSGELLYSKDKNLYYKERMRALSMYVALNEQRAEVLESIKDNRNIYGD